MNTVLMATKIGRMVTYLEGFLTIKSRSDHRFLQSHITNKNHISTTRLPMATKLGRIMTYFEGFLTIPMKVS